MSSRSLLSHLRGRDDMFRLTGVNELVPGSQLMLRQGVVNNGKRWANEAKRSIHEP